MISACGGADAPVVFELRISNVATGAVSGPSGEYDAIFSPGWARVSANDPLFVVGGLADSRLEGLAERGDPSGLVGSEGAPFPEGIEVTYESDPLAPGDTYAVRFEAREGDQLSFGTMLIPTNDVILGAEAFPLFDEDGAPVVGDVTARAGLFDVGTEVNEEPGFGDGQPMRGPGGTEESELIRRVEGTDAQGNAFPTVSALVRVELVRCASLDRC